MGIVLLHPLGISTNKSWLVDQTSRHCVDVVFAGNAL